MPSKECHVMDERLRFVVRLLEGEKMAPLCAEFGFSRKTGYKIYDRYKDCGVGAFSDRSRRPHRQANRLPAPIEATIVRLKREYPGWGAPKIREKLRQQFPGPHLPAISTVHAVLDRHHLVSHRRRRRQNVGVTQVGERIWLVTFMQYDLGYFDDETCRLEPIENPFGPKVLPMCSE
jgi:hypothetical protein